MRFGWLAAAAAMVCASQAGAVNWVTYEVRGAGTETFFAYPLFTPSTRAVDFQLRVTVDTDAGTSAGTTVPFGFGGYTSTGSIYSARYMATSVGRGTGDLLVDGTQSGRLTSTWQANGELLATESFNFSLDYSDADAAGGLPRSVATGAASGSLSYAISFPFSYGQQVTGNISSIAFLSQATAYAAPSFTAVPEPASWAMMIGGFGIVGGVLRRKRGVAARHATA